MDYTVAVVDDRSVTFRGVVEVLREAAGIRFVGVIPTLGECGPRVPGSEPTVVVADPFPGPPLPRMLPGHLRLLVMSTSQHPDDVQTALRHGAGGYIRKESDVETLLRAIDVVASGDFYLDGGLRAAFATGSSPVDPGQAAAPPGQAPLTRALTPREREVLRLVAGGLTHKQIGTRLGLSKTTVDTYVHRIRQKTGTPNKAGLTRIAMGLQLTGPALAR
ncbi:two-component system response regulator NarL [Micromonospora polyrhachis]|uniref:DNA-binding NarL/FixJ family response regulator n=1 Tax=Micromonospora polyrhachis TaxID=1282883 RepID=A0A7W7SMB3_9ACTN|nr:response regulator transcription factor [Micromonospora polyrhachis]MBB4957101.1 DNA-binding NarL/FixJ family response regulator [Micromonospora polyrhachis]